MKEAAGEANLTVVAIILIAVVVAVATPLVNSLMSTATYRSCCTDAGAVWSGGSCKWAKGTKTTDRGSINTNYRTCQSNANVKAIKSITNEQ